MAAKKLHQLTPQSSGDDISIENLIEPVSDEIRKVMRMEDKPVLTGDLTFMGLADILQLRGSIGDSGVLSIINPYTTPGLIYILNGDPINAVNSPKTGLEALNVFFGWTQGRFEFNRGIVQGKNIIKKGFMNIVLDALRMLDEGKIQKVSRVTMKNSIWACLRAQPLYSLSGDR